MLTQEIITYILGLSAVISIGVSIYNSLKKPQITGQINDAVFDEKLQGVSKSFDDKILNLEKVVVNLRDNHMHTVESKLDKHISDQQLSTIEQVKQMTRIETLVCELYKDRK